MKPRLRSADLTQEDWIAWLHARHGFLEIRWLDLIDAYETADRRDADLMLRARGYSKFAMKYQRTLFTELNPPDMDGMPPIGGVLVGGDQR